MMLFDVPTAGYFPTCFGSNALQFPPTSGVTFYGGPGAVGNQWAGGDSVTGAHHVGPMFPPPRLTQQHVPSKRGGRTGGQAMIPPGAAAAGASIKVAKTTAENE